MSFESSSSARRERAALAAAELPTAPADQVIRVVTEMLDGGAISPTAAKAVLVQRAPNVRRINQTHAPDGTPVLELEDPALVDRPDLKCTCQRCSRTLARLHFYNGEVRWRFANRTQAVQAVTNRTAPGESRALVTRLVCKCGRDIPVSDERLQSVVDRAVAFDLREVTL